MQHVSRKLHVPSPQGDLPVCTGPHRGRKRMLRRWVGSWARVASLGQVSRPWACASGRHEQESE